MKPKSNLSLYDLTKDEDEDGIEYLISGVLPKRGLAVLIGAYGTGKTQLAMRMGASVASGALFSYWSTPVHGDDIFYDFCMPRERGFTLYIAGEGKHNIRSRIKAATKAISDDALGELNTYSQSRFPIIPAKVDMPFKEGNHIDEIEDLIFLTRLIHHDLPERPALIIFDTLAASHEFKDDNHNSEMQKVVNHLQACSDHFDCCVLVLSHPPKSNDGPKGYNRGASTLVNSADVVFEIKKVNASKQRDVHIRKMKDGPYEGTRFKFKIESFGPAPAFTPIRTASNKNTKPKADAAIDLNDTQNMVLELLKDVDKNGMLQKDIIQTLLNGRKDIENKDSERRLISRYIKQLVDLGMLDKEGKGKRIILRVVQGDAPEMGSEDNVFPTQDEYIDEDDEFESDEDIGDDVY